MYRPQYSMQGLAGNKYRDFKPYFNLPVGRKSAILSCAPPPGSINGNCSLGVIAQPGCPIDLHQYHSHGFGHPTRRSPDKPLSNTGSVEGGKHIPDVFFYYHILVTAHAPVDIIHLKSYVRRTLVHERSQQHGHFRVILIRILPAPCLPV